MPQEQVLGERSGASASAGEERRVLIQPCSWERFGQLSALFPDHHSVRLTFIDGVLEIMSPIGERHERHKRTNRLLRFACWSFSRARWRCRRQR